MKKILFFYQDTCPFCIRAMDHLRSLKEEHSAFQKLEIEMIDENKEKERANQYDYYYVPTLYFDEVKVHEGILNRAKLETLLQEALH